LDVMVLNISVAFQQQQNMCHQGQYAPIHIQCTGHNTISHKTGGDVETCY